MSTKLLFVRFVINGLTATLFHYIALYYQLEVAQVQSAGIANFFAAILGIGVSFIGNRFFVFQARDAVVTSQAGRFLLVYGLLACYHALFLYFWADVFLLDYRFGFLLCTTIQMVLSFFFNKIFVFPKSPAHSVGQSNRSTQL